MRILLTNDDGIEAEGIRAFASLLSSFAEVAVVAPKSPRSCCSHAVTTDRLIQFGNTEPNWYWVDGYPADCVRVGIMHLNLNPDWILSGVNHGGNLGVDTWMSGTVAAAREGALLGYPSAAISQYRHPSVQLDWQASSDRALRTFLQLSTQPLDRFEFWNINLPALHGSDPFPEVVQTTLEPRPLCFTLEATEQGLIYHSNYQKRAHTTDSDVGNCFGGRISVTKLIAQPASESIPADRSAHVAL